MKTLVTGAQGFIGRYLCAELVGAGHDVTGLGRSPESQHFSHSVTWQRAAVPAPLPSALARQLAAPSYRYLPLDLADAPQVAELFRAESFDVVFHLAGALRDSPMDLLVRSNILASHAVFEAAGSLDRPPRIVLGSSGSVAGPVPEDRLPVSEDADAPVEPIDDYAVTKRAAENLAHVARRRHGLDISIGRIFAVVGPGQEERHLCGHLARQFAERHAEVSEDDIQVGPLHTTRDFVDVRDVCAGLIAVARALKAPDLFNLASGIETPTQQVFQDLKALTHDSAELAPSKPGRALELGRSFACISKLSALGYAPRFELRQSLADLLAWYENDVAAAHGRIS